jgi:hypothetical protein
MVQPCRFAFNGPKRHATATIHDNHHRSDKHEVLTNDNHPDQPAKMIVVTPDILLDAVQPRAVYRS